eukprot:scaffold3337_cov256-Chaetoceros_neogracile.AAC.19
MQKWNKPACLAMYKQTKVCMRVNHSNANPTLRYSSIIRPLHTDEVRRLTNLSKSENIICSIKFCRKLQHLMPKTNAVGLYSFHLKFAYEAITMLLDLCRDNVLKPFERLLIVEARGPSYRDWRLVS